MMLGRAVSQPISLMFETRANKTKVEEPHAYVQNLKDRIQRVHALVKQNIGKAQRYQKRNNDLKQNVVYGQEPKEKYGCSPQSPKKKKLKIVKLHFGCSGYATNFLVPADWKRTV